jgi:hypothetical protein
MQLHPDGDIFVKDVTTDVRYELSVDDSQSLDSTRTYAPRKVTSGVLGGVRWTICPF